MAPHSSTLAWKIPWTEEPGRLQSMGSLRVGHDWATSLSLFPFMHWRRKWQPLQCSCPRDGGAWWAAVSGVAQSRTQLKWLSSSSSSSSIHIYYVCIYVCVFILSSYLNENRETLLLLIMCLHDHYLLAHADKPILFCTYKARLSQSWHCESVHFSHSVMSESLWPHGLQHARLACLSPTTGACSNSCSLSQGWHPTISSSVFPLSSCLQSFPASGSFSSKSVLCIRCPKYWSFSFSISPSNKYSGLISFRIDWLDLADQGTPKSLLQNHSSKASILWHSAFFTVQLSHPYMTTGKTIALTAFSKPRLYIWKFLVHILLKN